MSARFGSAVQESSIIASRERNHILRQASTRHWVATQFLWNRTGKVQDAADSAKKILVVFKCAVGLAEIPTDDILIRALTLFASRETVN